MAQSSFPAPTNKPHSLDKPLNIDEYKYWLENKLGIVIDSQENNHYESVAHKIKYEFEKSEFWRDFSAQFKETGQKYHISTGFNLYIDETPNNLLVKSFESFLLKTYRKNILNNQSWPEAPPVHGWITPDNWFEQVNDVVRTNIVVKYLDGVDYLAREIVRICKEKNFETKVDYEAKEEGYYAAHCYIKFPVEVPQKDWTTTTIVSQVEIQITTQLQDVIKRLLHVYYDERRKIATPENKKWQWDYSSNEFSTNYLGHILHYVEGMIMDIREKMDKEEKDK